MSEEGGGKNLSRAGFLAAMGAAAYAIVTLGRSSSGEHQQEATTANRRVAEDAESRETMKRLRPYKRENFKVVTLGNVQPREQKGTMDDPITAPNPWTAVEKGYSQDIRSKHPYESSLEPGIKQASGVDTFHAGEQLALPDPDLIGHFYCVKKGEKVPGYEELGVFSGFDLSGPSFSVGGVNDNKFSFADTFEKNGDRYNLVFGLKGPSGERLLVVREPLIQETPKTSR